MLRERMPLTARWPTPSPSPPRPGENVFFAVDLRAASREPSPPPPPPAKAALQSYHEALAMPVERQPAPSLSPSPSPGGHHGRSVGYRTAPNGYLHLFSKGLLVHGIPCGAEVVATRRIRIQGKSVVEAHVPGVVRGPADSGDGSRMLIDFEGFPTAVNVLPSEIRVTSEYPLHCPGCGLELPDRKRVEAEREAELRGGSTRASGAGEPRHPKENLVGALRGWSAAKTAARGFSAWRLFAADRRRTQDTRDTQDTQDTPPEPAAAAADSGDAAHEVRSEPASRPDTAADHSEDDDARIDALLDDLESKDDDDDPGEGAPGSDGGGAPVEEIERESSAGSGFGLSVSKAAVPDALVRSSFYERYPEMRVSRREHEKVVAENASLQKELLAFRAVDKDAIIDALRAQVREQQGQLKQNASTSPRLRFDASIASSIPKPSRRRTLESSPSPSQSPSQYYHAPPSHPPPFMHEPFSPMTPTLPFRDDYSNPPSSPVQNIQELSPVFQPAPPYAHEDPYPQYDPPFLREPVTPPQAVAHVVTNFATNPAPALTNFATNPTPALPQPSMPTMPRSMPPALAGGGGKQQPARRPSVSFAIDLVTESRISSEHTVSPHLSETLPVPPAGFAGYSSTPPRGAPPPPPAQAQYHSVPSPGAAWGGAAQPRGIVRSPPPAQQGHAPHGGVEPPHSYPHSPQQAASPSSSHHSRGSISREPQAMQPMALGSPAHSHHSRSSGYSPQAGVEPGAGGSPVHSHHSRASAFSPEGVESPALSHGSPHAGGLSGVPAAFASLAAPPSGLAPLPGGSPGRPAAYSSAPSLGQVQARTAQAAAPQQYASARPYG
eukprot:gene11507-17717_t